MSPAVDGVEAGLLCLPPKNLGVTPSLCDRNAFKPAGNLGISFATSAFMKTMLQQRHVAKSVNVFDGRGSSPSRPTITCDDRRKLGAIATDDELRVEPHLIAELEFLLEDAVYVEREVCRLPSLP
jgi:hypothetical protein